MMSLTLLAGIVVRKTDRKNPSGSLGEMVVVVEEVFLVDTWESPIADLGELCLD